MKEQDEKDLQATKEVQPLVNDALNNVNGGKTTLNEVESLSEEELERVNGGTVTTKRRPCIRYGNCNPEDCTPGLNGMTTKCSIYKKYHQNK